MPDVLILRIAFELPRMWRDFAAIVNERLVQGESSLNPGKLEIACPDQSANAIVTSNFCAGEQTQCDAVQMHGT